MPCKLDKLFNWYQVRGMRYTSYEYMVYGVWCMIYDSVGEKVFCQVVNRSGVGPTCYEVRGTS